MSRTTKRVLTGLVLVLVAVLAVLGLRGRGLPTEVTRATRATVREYIAEDAKTRLADDYLIDMPVSGTLERIALEEGDRVAKGDIVAQVESFTLDHQIKGMEALIEQARSQITGVDVSKPKPEDLDAADVRVRQMRDNLAMAQKERAIVDINFAEAEREYNRVKALHDQGAVSQSAFDEAERLYKSLGESRAQAKLAEDAAHKGLQAAELSAKRIHGSVDDNEYMRDSIEAEIENLEAQLEILKRDLEKTRVRAPVDSILLEKYVDDRRVLMAGTPVMKLGDIATIEIESDVLSEEVGRIEVGDSVEISGKAVQAETIMGTVKRIYPSGFMKISALGVEQQRVKVIIEFDNSELALRPGTSVDIRVITDEHGNALAVPERSTFRYEGSWAVFVVRGGHAYLTPVEVGLKNDDWAEVASGLSEEDIVVSEPGNDLEDGVRVAVLGD